MNEETKTLKEWNKEGYWVIKGEKAANFTEDGKALFIKNQTRAAFPKPTNFGGRSSGGGAYSDADWDNMDLHYMEFH